MSSDEIEPCPACGGAGGGPLGRAGGAWDTEDYVCPRCKGAGVLTGDATVPRPGVTKAKPTPAPQRKKAAGDPS
jgi:hypothetical protein